MVCHVDLDLGGSPCGTACVACHVDLELGGSPCGTAYVACHVDLDQGCLLCRDGPCSVTTSRQNRHDDGTTSCRTLSLP